MNIGTSDFTRHIRQLSTTFQNIGAEIISIFVGD